MTGNAIVVKRASMIGRACFAGILALSGMAFGSPSAAHACPLPPDEVLNDPDPNAINRFCSGLAGPWACGPLGAAPLMLAAGFMGASFVSRSRNLRSLKAGSSARRCKAECPAHR